jgi:Putative metallopeptidase
LNLDQPEADITVAYREAKGSLEPIANALKSIKLLEAVAVHTAEAFVWPAPFKLEAQSCGFPNARWVLNEHKLFVCYELAADFADLYGGYGAKRCRSARCRRPKRSDEPGAAGRRLTQSSRPFSEDCMRACADDARPRHSHGEVVGVVRPHLPDFATSPHPRGAFFGKRQNSERPGADLGNY